MDFAFYFFPRRSELESLLGVTRRETGFSGVSFICGAERFARPHPETFSAGSFEPLLVLDFLLLLAASVDARGGRARFLVLFALASVVGRRDP